MTPEEMRVLYDYNAWANHRAGGAAAALSAEQFPRALGSSLSSVRDTLAHICSGEWVWLERFQGRSPAAFPDAQQFTTAAGLREHWRAQDSALLAFVSGLTQDDLNGVMEYKTFKFG